MIRDNLYVVKKNGRIRFKNCISIRNAFIDNNKMRINMLTYIMIINA